MKKELIVAAVILISLMAVFIFSVIITESNNIKKIRENNPPSESIKNTDTISVPPTSDKALSYHKNKVTVWIISLIWGLAVPAFFVFSGLSSKLMKWAGGVSRNFIIIVILYFVVYMLINYLLDLPLNFYAGFIRKHAYGLLNQTIWKWISDSSKGFLLTSVIGGTIVWVPYLLIKKLPGYWWLYAGLLTIPFLIFTTYISPIYIDPIFNKYITVENRELDGKIHELIKRTTIGDCKVYQINKSVDTKEMNAYMTGVFNTKRIVLWDTTINNLEYRETLAVVAHEMGHYLMGHVWKSILIGGVSSILLLYLVDKTALWVITASKGSFGFVRLYDAASLPLLILLINIITFIFTPVSNGYSRYIEKEADRFELELIKDNYAAASSIVKLHYNSLIIPEPGNVYKLWVYSHPSFKERVDFSNSYRPWEKNEILKYGKFIVK